MTAPVFTPEELQAMHRYCLKYRDLVRSGGKPSPGHDMNFLLYSAICYRSGVARG